MAIEEQVLSATFSFREVGVDDVGERPMKSQATLPESLFRTRHSAQSVDLRPIVGHGRPPYPSYTPESMRFMAESLIAAAHCMPQLELLGQCWRSQFMYVGCLFWRKSNPKETELWWSLGSHSHSCLLWPAHVVQVEKVRRWCLRDISCVSELRWVTVTSFADWQVLPTEPITLAKLWESLGRRIPPLEVGMVRVQSERRPMPMLAFGAKQCFFDLKADLIDKLGRQEFGLSFSAGEAFPHRLLRVLFAVLGCSKAGALDILEMRSFRQELLANGEEVLQPEGVQDAMTAPAAKEAESLLEKIGRQKQEQLVVQALLRERRAGRTVRPVKFVGDGEVAPEASNFKRFLPTDRCRIYRDTFNSRWIVFYKSTKWSTNESWGAGREWPCIVAVLQNVWRHHESVSGEKCPFTGLF